MKRLRRSPLRAFLVALFELGKYYIQAEKVYWLPIWRTFFTTETKCCFQRASVFKDLTILFKIRHHTSIFERLFIDFCCCFHLVDLFQRTFKTDGLEAIRKHDNKKAIELLQLSLKHEKSNVEEQRKTLKYLCELYFGETSFQECLATGQKLKATYWGEKGEDNDSFRVSLSYNWW